MAGGIDETAGHGSLRVCRFMPDTRIARGHAGPHSDRPRPYDLPWVVLNASRAATSWEWKAQTLLADVFEEIAGS